MTRQSRARWTGQTAALLAVGGAVLIAGCGSSSSPGSSSGSARPTTTSPMPASTPASPAVTATASAAECKHINSLRGSLTDLTHLTLSANSATRIKTDLTNISAQLTALKNEPGTAAFAAEADQLNSALDQVKTAAQHASSDPSHVVSALSNLKAKSTAMVAQMKAACPASS